MDIDAHYELDEQEISDRYANGEIDNIEYQKEISDLRREFMDMAEDQAQRAYAREMDWWY